MRKNIRGFAVFIEAGKSDARRIKGFDAAGI